MRLQWAALPSGKSSLPGWGGPPLVCCGTPGRARGSGKPAAAGRLGAGGEGCPLQPRPFPHSGDSAPALRGSGCEQETESSASPLPQNRPRPLWGKAQPRGGAAPSGLAVPTGSRGRQDRREARSGEEGEKAQRALMEKKSCFPGTL